MKFKIFLASRTLIFGAILASLKFAGVPIILGLKIHIAGSCLGAALGCGGGQVQILRRDQLSTATTFPQVHWEIRPISVQKNVLQALTSRGVAFMRFSREEGRAQR